MTVIQRLYLDWRNKEWGKWRPSTAARRKGAIAIELERLVLRDRLPFDEAVEHLLARRLAASRDECDEIWAALPQRPSRRNVLDGDLEGMAAPASPDGVVVSEQRERAARTSAVLTRALGTLDAADHLIIRLRFQDGFTVARIAQLVGHDQRALYRRIDQLLTRMRETLLANGVSAADIGELLGSAAVDFPASFGMRPGNQQSVRLTQQT